MTNQTLTVIAREASPWKRLVGAAFWANVPALSVLLMLGLLREAVSIAFGLGLSLLSYGLLYRDLDRAMRLLKRAGGPIAQGSLSWAQAGRFTLLAATLLLLFLFVPVSILCLLFGYLVTQVAVSITALKIRSLFHDC